MSFAVTLRMIMVLMHMQVSAKNRKELSQTVNSLISTISAEKGCGRCELFHGLEDEYSFCLLEEWDTPISFAAHCKSECFKVLRGAMNLLEEPFEIISYISSPPLLKNWQKTVSKHSKMQEQATTSQQSIKRKPK